MAHEDLIFVGFNRRVAALDRKTGGIIWEWRAHKGSSYVTLLLDNDILVVAVDGYMYGLDAATGLERWFNPMAGYGTGVTSLASARSTAQNIAAAAAAIAAKRSSSSSSSHASSHS